MTENEKDKNQIQRRSVVKAVGTAVVTGLALQAGNSQAQQSQNGGMFTPQKHNEDRWYDELPGSHRAFIDTSTRQGGIDALRYANNILNGHRDFYGGSDSDYAMIICYRHMSTPFAYSDENWRKYGAIFAEIMGFPESENGEAPDRNPLGFVGSAFRGMTLSDMAARGVHYAICSSATNFFSNTIASRTGASFESVLNELKTDPVTNGRFVPAGVVATTRAQEYGYSLLYSAG